MEELIRQVRPEDLKALTEMEWICFPQAEAAGEESLKERIATFPESFFVAQQGEKLIGMINGCVTNQETISDDLFENAGLHCPDGSWQAIFGLDVLPEYRRHGVAARLMERMIAHARDMGRKGLILTCKTHLIHYYETFGYQNQGISASVHGGAVWYDMILRF